MKKKFMCHLDVLRGVCYERYFKKIVYSYDIEAKLLRNIWNNIREPLENVLEYNMETKLSDTIKGKE